MKPNSKLIIRLTLPDGAMQGWGYDHPHYEEDGKLRSEIQNDFAVFPKNTEVRLFYYKSEKKIKASTAKDLANKTIKWMISTGDYNGN